jgi:1,4-alpha-glucan branching enzyme
MHQNEIGVIIDWVPGHFPKDEHGLSRFDGTALYEHEDSRKGEHKEWGTLVFNYGRTEVSNFLLSSALFWFEHYHVDGLRVDAVSSMLYLDYSREEGEWLPNVFNGRENLEAVEFLKRMNILIHDKFPGVITIAEESTSWPGVSRPTHSNGLGFTMKWNMGWMHDILGYFRKDPVYRKYHHGVLTFSLLYAFDENFILTLSHDEVVHGKGSLFDKMPGDLWQKFANLRLLYGYMFAHPGKKMLFQGLDIGQKEEWNFDGSVEWSLLENQSNAKLHRYMSDLGRLYLDSPSLWESDFTVDGFEWIDHSDTENSVISFMRKGKKLGDYMIFIFNFTPTPRENYLVGSPELGRYIEVFNSDSESYNGSNMGNMGVVQAYEGKRGKWKFHFSVTLPPLSVIAMKPLY